MPNPTTRLGLTKPTIDNTTVWGDQLNTDLDIVDAGVEILADKDQANGYPSLDATGKVPIGEIPVSAVVGGNAMDIQFNNGAGGFGGSDSFIWNNAVGLLAISNLTPATILTPQNSPVVSLNGKYWNWAGPASATDSWQIQSALTAGKTFTVTNSSESAVSVVTLTVPGHTFLVGEFITVTGLTNIPWINGLRLQVIGIPFSTNLVRVIDTTHHGTQGSGVENATAVSYPATDLSITHSGSSGFAQVAMPAALVGVPATSLSPAAQDFLLIGASEAGTFRVFTNNNSEDGGAVLFFNDVQDVSNRNISGTISTLMITPQANVTLGNGATFGTVLACYHEGNFNYSSMIGVQINIGSDPTGDIGGSATISEMIALDVEPPFGPVSGGGVTTSTSIRLGDCNGSFLGTIGTSYAINIAAQTNGGTSHWAIFEADATCFNQLGPTTFLGLVTFQGSSTGTAAITVAAAAGTPNTLVLPIATGAAGAVLATDGGNPQQLSWTAPSALTILWNNLQNATGNLTLANAGFSTTFNQTSAVNWTWANTTAATSGTSQSSPILNINGQYWNGSASATDQWTIQNVQTNGTNGASTLTFAHTGSSGLATISAPRIVSVIRATGNSAAVVESAAGTGNLNWPNNSQLDLVLGGTDCIRFTTGFVTIGQSIPITLSAGSGGSQGDAGISRLGAASFALGNGTASDFTASLKLKSITLSDTVANTDLTIQNTTAATSGVSQSSPIITINGTYWTSAASATDSWTIQNVIANGTNGISQLTFTHSGSSGAAQVLVPKGTSANPGIAFAAAPGDGMYLDASNNLVITNANSGARVQILAANQSTLESGNGATVTCFGNTLKTIGISGGSLQIVNTGVIGWSSNSTSTTAPDAAFSRLGAASVALGNGTTGDFTGSLTLGALTQNNAVASTNSVSQSSPLYTIQGTYWTGAASAADSWTLQNVIANGTNGTSSLTFTHSGTSGSSRVFMPLLDVTGSLGFTTQAAAGGITNANSYRFTANSNDSWSIGVNSGNAALFAAGAGGIIAWANGRPQSNGALASISQSSGIVQIGTTATGDSGGALRLGTLTLTVAAPTVAAAQVGLGSTTSATATAGAATLPANPVGFLIINVAGTQMKIPYYNT